MTSVYRLTALRGIVSVLIILFLFSLSESTTAQPMISTRVIDYFPSVILGSEVSESMSTRGSGTEFNLEFTGKRSKVVFGVSVVLEEFTISSLEAGDADYSMSSVGFLTDLRYRFSTSPIQPYLALQVGINTLDVEKMSDGLEQGLTDAGVLIIPSGGFMFTIKNLLLLDLNIRSHRSMGGEIIMSDEATTIGFNGIGIGLGAGLLL